MLDGEWHLVREADPKLFGHSAYNQVIRSAAHSWGQAHGYRVRGKARDRGARYYIQFTKGWTPWKNVEPPS